MISGTAGEQPIIEFENHLASDYSIIQKRIIGSNVPAGSELVWRVERYTDGKWAAAEGVPFAVQSYSFVYNNSASGSPIPAFDGVTGEDGLIRIKTEDTFLASDRRAPYGSVIYVTFTDKVYVNHTVNVQEGDLRVVELESESDEAWGWLDSYITSPAPSGQLNYIDYNMLQYYGVNFMSNPYAYSGGAHGFVNTTKYAGFRVEKVVDVPSDQVFTFTLREYPDIMSDTDLIPGANIPYVVYDTATGEEVRSGVTGADGKFTLQGGQYALFMVKPRTRWNVTEERSLPYTLEKVEVNGTVIDNPGSNGDVSLIGDPETIRKSNIIRSDFREGVICLLERNGLSQSPDMITRVLFGTPSQYPEAVSDTYEVMDSYGLDTIRGYLKPSETMEGMYDLYILSDDLMYLNPYSGYMFSEFYRLQEVRFDNVSSEKTVNMQYMFNNCSSLQTVNLGALDTSNVVNMRGMFRYCGLPAIDVGALETGKVTDMSEMFEGCYGTTELDLSGWDVGSVENMNRMFAGCSNLQTLNVAGWDTGNVKDMGGMFSSTGIPALDLSSWNVSNVRNMSSMFQNTYNLQTLNVNGWDTGNVEDMSYMFNNCGLETLDLSHFRTGNVRNMYYMFGYSRLRSLNLDNWDLSSASSLRYMFQGSSLEELSAKNWKFAQGASLQYLFSDCRSLRLLDLAGWDTDGVTDMSYMFRYCTSLQTLDLSGWNTGAVTTMYNMFSNCSSLKTLNTQGWNTANVSSMQNMFEFCSSLETLDISHWNTGRVNSTSYMFQYCTSLKDLKMTGWTMPNLSTMQRMFDNCTSLESLDLSGWNPSNLYYTSSAFNNCKALKTLDITNMKATGFSSYSNVSYMFGNCSQLSTIYCNQDWRSTHRISSYIYYTYMFSGCTALPNYNSSRTSIAYAYPGDGGYFTAKS